MGVPLLFLRSILAVMRRVSHATLTKPKIEKKPRNPERKQEHEKRTKRGREKKLNKKRGREKREPKHRTFGSLIVLRKK